MHKDTLINNIQDICTQHKKISIELETRKIETRNYAFTCLRVPGEENILEEIIHLSLIFSLFNIDYEIKDQQIERKVLQEFSETTESIFECLSFIQSFCKSKDGIKVLEAINLCHKAMSKYICLLNIFTNITNNQDSETYFQQIIQNCETMKMIFKTIYHLSTQSRHER